MKLLGRAYKQKNGWTCGPAVTKIILNYSGKTCLDTNLAKELKTTPSGTSNSQLVKFLKKKGVKFRVREGASLDALKRFSKKSLVLVTYWIPNHKEHHYSIVKKVSSKRIYFHDTWFGANHSYTIGHFRKNWWDDEAKSSWLLAVKK
ncbi:MAG: C39 family peptidase [Candidatus Yanofskybacteria bacterium]|nr:C39 family peptidase [Candidatus Yanofskybacteria bacterium]